MNTVNTMNPLNPLLPSALAARAAAPAHSLQWNVEQLYHQLASRLPALSIEVVSEIASTNTALLERARVASRVSAEGDAAQVRRSTEARAFGRRNADQQPCLLVAEKQTQGRGRQGRAWQSAAGASLTFSLSMPLAPVDWSGFSLAVGVALADALNPPGGTAVAPWIGIKWPNDLWLMPAALGNRGSNGAGSEAGVVGRKLGGLLVETVAAGARRLVVVGVGLNVLPISLDPAQATSGFACLQELDAEAHEPISAPQVLSRIALPLVEALQRFEREGFAAFADRFAARDVLRGRAVHAAAGLADGAASVPRATVGRRTGDAAPAHPLAVDGVADGVSGTGALRVRAADGLREVVSGEVSVRIQPAAVAPC